MDIVVLCGGLSTERDVSLSSGCVVAEALVNRGHRVVLMDLYFGYTDEFEYPSQVFEKAYEGKIYKVEECEPDLLKVKKSRNQDNDSLMGDNVIDICRAADITFLALHGDEGENGKIQAAFDIAGVKYTGCGYLGSALAMNKTLSKILYQANGISTPPGITLSRGEFELPDMGFPCVVKPCSGGSSVGTSIVGTREEYEEALKLAFGYEDKVIVEKYIKGREFTVGVIEDFAMPVIEIIPKSGFYDYINKYQAGLTLELCPAPIEPETEKRLKDTAVKASSALMIETYSRSDFIMDESGEIYCIETNTLPGMTPTSLIPMAAAELGMSYGELCEKIIEVSLKKYQA